MVPGRHVDVIRFPAPASWQLPTARPAFGLRLLEDATQPQGGRA
ncbi:hypothetical protein [Nonomuraea dietziae]